MSVRVWLAVSACVLLASCGSHGSTPTAQLPEGSQSPTVARAFWTRADAACRPLGHWFDAHPRALGDFDPSAPTSASLRRFAVVARTIPLYQPGTLTGIARRLGDPAGGTDTWSTVVGDFRRFDDITARQVRDAVRGDVRGWKRDFQIKAVFLGRVGGDLVAAGAPIDNSCLVLLGG